ncbi:hypothetical protein BC937DRAFT_91078 [Endogone sp. FLAS-F59071]|nr:hypothetical protein BC937DRAFT_91078 [Endogone sp. FLAS-F59071]|eukprot:RUS16558.1 hypothetical protein BC937DRAFT_91078 [Endogone sp. FLAS-F59071]
MTGELVVGGIDAWQKSVALGQAILFRTRAMIKQMGMSDFRAVNIESLGAEHTYGSNSKAHATREVVLRITVHHDNKQALRVFGMELAPAATCMAPGITGLYGTPLATHSFFNFRSTLPGGGSGRPHPSPNLVHFSCLVPKSRVPAQLTVGAGETRIVKWEVEGVEGQHVSPPLEPATSATQVVKDVPTEKVILVKVAYGRSGDKGDCCNIGIIARDPKYYPYLKQALTEQVIADYMAHLCQGTVKRYELPGSYALNFVLTKSLGGGGLSSLRVDRQGKTYAQMLLSGIAVEVPIGLMAKLDGWEFEHAI